MKQFFFLSVLLAVSCGVSAADVSLAPEVSQDLSARMKQTPAAHPRLFFSEKDTAVLKAKLDGDALLKGAYERLRVEADDLLGRAVVERKKIGKRLLGVSRTCLQRVSYLSFVYRVSKEEKYLKRAEQEMLAAAAFEDWNPSHFLDVAEMTLALAMGYDWLYDGLDASARDTIREAIVKKGLEPSLKGGSWVTGTNNWNQVCHGGMVVGALAVMEDQPALAQRLVERAIACVPGSMAEYEPDGVYPEGPSYWKYGTTFNVVMIAALESVLGSDFGLASAPGFRKTPTFYMQAVGPTGQFFNYSDCGTRGGVGAAMYWFAQHLHEPSLLWRENRELENLVAGKPDPGDADDRMFPLLLLWAQPVTKLESPKVLSWKGDGRTPVAMLRNSWQDDATFVGFKGGSPSTGHAHMDVGSFVLDMKGVRWAVDLGAQSYNSLESVGVDLWNKRQDGGRWTVFRINNFSHNTLVVDGQLQQVAGKGTITGFSDALNRPYAIVEMSSVYDGQLAQVQRGIRLFGTGALIQDEIKALDRPSTVVRWALATKAEVSLEGDRLARLKQDGQTVSLSVLQPEGAKLSVQDIEKPPHEYDEKNPNTRMIVFETTLPALSAETCAVYVASDTGAMPSIEALAAWKAD